MKLHQTDNQKIITSEFRASFCHVVKPGKTLNGDMKYMVTMLFPKASFNKAVFDEACKNAAIKKWGSLANAPKKMTSPLKDGDDQTQFDPTTYKGYAGHWVVYCSSSDAVPVVESDAVTPITDEKRVYSGSYGFAVIRAFGYDTQAKKGVSFGLCAYQRSRDGEAFSSRGNDFKLFEPQAGDSASNYGNNAEANALFT